MISVPLESQGLTRESVTSPLHVLMLSDARHHQLHDCVPHRFGILRLTGVAPRLIHLNGSNASSSAASSTDRPMETSQRRLRDCQAG